MTAFVLIHGSGDGGWAWHLLQRALAACGYEAAAPDLPSDRDGATWHDCAGVVAQAVGPADEVVVVGHSSGGFVVPLAAHRMNARLQVFLAAMVPHPGEVAADWFGHVGWQATVAELARGDQGLTGHPDPMVAFYHDVPVPLARQAMVRERPTSQRLAEMPWPSTALPPIEARYIVTAQDRFIPPPVQRRVAADRLGITEPDEIDAGHCANLSRPEELARMLVDYVSPR